MEGKMQFHQNGGSRARPGNWAIGALLALSITMPLPAIAQLAPAQYQPESGQAGKDVVWVRTPQALVDRMLDMAKVTPKDRLIDLGSGDGRTVITAAKRGLSARGIEYNPDMVALARRNAVDAEVAERATFEQADLFETDLSQAEVITLFLLPAINEKLRPRILDLAPGTRIVSNTFDMGDWPADETSAVGNGCERWCRALLWIVPAKVHGTWRMGENELRLSQRYQSVAGSLGSTTITDVKLDGTKISFTANGVRYTGTVNGDTMTGDSSSGGSWSASRG
jgi:SAM-dependent methyltransferase